MQQDIGYLGRVQRGQEVAVVVRTVDGSGQPAWPPAAPTLTIYAPSGAVALQVVMAADLQGVADGTFRLSPFLGRAFGATGRHQLVARYAAGGQPRYAVGHFDLLPGGSADGAVTALQPVHRPNANFLMQSTDGGKLTRGANPR